MTVIMLCVAAVVIAAALPAYIVFAAHNRLVALDQRCETAFADIDAHLKHRQNLIPGLVETVRGVANGAHAVPRAAVPLLNTTPLANPLERESAATILSGLSYSHRAGTARTACEQVFDATRCRGIDWLAGKTGTPRFPSEGVPLDELAQLCRGDTAMAKPPRRIAAPATSREKERPVACSSLRPY